MHSLPFAPISAKKLKRQRPAKPKPHYGLLELERLKGWPDEDGLNMKLEAAAAYLDCYYRCQAAISAQSPDYEHATLRRRESPDVIRARRAYGVGQKYAEAVETFEAARFSVGRDVLPCLDDCLIRKLALSEIGKRELGQADPQYCKCYALGKIAAGLDALFRHFNLATECAR